MAKQKYGVSSPKPVLKVYIMTSEDDHDYIVNFFQKRDYFGLPRESIKFFQQQSLPAMDYYGKIIMEEKHKIYKAPNGSGGVYIALLRNKILKDFDRKEQGITYVHMIGIDNILAKPADPFAIGFADSNKFDITNRFLKRTNNSLDCRLLLQRNHKLHAMEPSEVTESLLLKKDQLGQPAFNLNYILDGIFNVSFLEEVISFKRKELAKNYHIVKKKIKYYDESLKDIVIPLENNGYQFELYAYDVFQVADKKKIGLLEASRDDEYAPVKYFSDGEQFHTKEARSKLSDLHRKWLKECNIKYQDIEDQEGLLEIDVRKVYDKYDPNLNILCKQYQDKVVILPAYLKLND